MHSEASKEHGNMQKAEIKYLFDRNGTFYFRRVIPHERRIEFTKPGDKLKREWVHSLNTKSLTEALPLLAQYAERYDCILSNRSNASGDNQITHLRTRSRQLGGAYRYVDVHRKRAH